MERFPKERLHRFTREVFEHYGVPEKEAHVAADVLQASDLRGIQSHGVARLWAYVRLFEDGRVNPNPDVKVLRETASTAAIDGDNGLGLVVGPKANELAIAKAAESGMSWVTVCGSTHYGIAGYYPLQAIARGFIGWSMTNASPGVTPLWGMERQLGTNPIAVGFPAGEEEPVVIDMSTAVASVGQVENARRRGEKLPDGWIIDSEGRPSREPQDLFDGGCLLPLGSDREHGGHKGYCLGSLVDLLTGVLSGANWGPFVPTFLTPAPDARTVGHGVGHLFAAMQVEAFLDQAVYRQRIDSWVRTQRSTRPMPDTDGPLIPGEPEVRAEEERELYGIPLFDDVVERLREISRSTGVRFDG